MVQSLTIFARAVLSVDSNGTKNLLKDLIGSVGYALLKCHLRGVMLRIDTERKMVIITRDGKTDEISFDEIERAVNE